MTASPYLTLDRAAWHEANHAAAMLLGDPPLAPRMVRIDRPTSTEAGLTGVDWGPDGATRGKARTMLRAIVCGGLTDGGPTDGGPWDEWPLDPTRFPHTVRRDVEQAAHLADYLRVTDRAGWLSHIHHTLQMQKRQDFRRLLVRITEALAHSEVLDKQDLIDLLEPAAPSTEDNA